MSTPTDGEDFLPGATFYEATAKHLATLPDTPEGRDEYDRLTAAFPDDVKTVLAPLAKMFAASGPDPLHEQAKEDAAQYARLLGAERARERRATEKAAGSTDFMSTAGSLAEAFEKGIPEPTWAIDGLLPENGNASLIAAKKTGKTTMMNHLTRSIVDGIPFLGQYKAEQGRVAFWNYEVDERQWLRWASESGIQNAELVFPLHLRGRSITLRSEAVRAQIIEWLGKREIQYWILDPGHRAVTGYDSEKNDEVTEFTEMLDVIKLESGVKSIVLPLHTPHDNDRARGAARWADWPDAIWTYALNKKAGCRTLRAEGRDVDLAESMITYHSSDRSLKILTGTLSQDQQEERSIEDEILSFLVNNPDVHPKKGEIGQRLGKGKKPAMDAADRLVAMNRAHWQAGTRNSQMLYYGPANLLLKAPSPSNLD